MSATTFSLIASPHLLIVLGLWFLGALIVLGRPRDEARARKR